MLFQSWLTNCTFHTFLDRNKWQMSYPLRALCTHGKPLRSPQPPARTLMTARSHHPGPQPNFPMTVHSQTPQAKFFYDMRVRSSRFWWLTHCSQVVYICACHGIPRLYSGWHMYKCNGVPIPYSKG